MPPELERITQEVLALPATSRALLAQKLMESLEDGEHDEVARAWAEVAEHRCREIDEGAVELLPGDDVMSELFARYR